MKIKLETLIKIIELVHEIVKLIQEKFNKGEKNE